MTKDFWINQAPLDDVMELGDDVALGLQAENDCGVGPLVIAARMRRAM